MKRREKEKNRYGIPEMKRDAENRQQNDERLLLWSSTEKKKKENVFFLHSRRNDSISVRTFYLFWRFAFGSIPF